MRVRSLNPCVMLFSAAMTLGLVALQGCSKQPSPLPPPHAVDDAASASRRASEAMNSIGSPAVNSPSGAAASEQVQPSKADGSQ